MGLVAKYRRFRQEHLVFQYFTLVATAWQALLWGGSVLAVAWGVRFIVGTWPEWVNWTAVLVAFVAGYHVWRTDHVRLIPEFEVKQFVEQSTPVLFGGRPIGTAIYFQLVPKCLTDANVEECRGFLTAVHVFREQGDTSESEVLPLQWSHGDTQKPAEPLTLCPGAENRLNVFSIDSDQPDVRRCVFPWPARFTQKFSRSPIALQNFSAVRFFIQLTASDCAPVKVTMTVTLTTEPFHPIVELE